MERKDRLGFVLGFGFEFGLGFVWGGEIERCIEEEGKNDIF